MPTPFGSRPFEFLVGFRKTFYLFGLTYFLMVISVLVENFQLGAFSLGLSLFVMMSYYQEPESEIYIWVFSLSAKRFLFEKVKTFVLPSSILIFPIGLVLSIFFPNKIYILLIIWVLGLFFAIAIILAKYASYPQKNNIPDGVLIGLSFVLPPFLLFVIPYFHKRSVRRLNNYLL